MLWLALGFMVVVGALAIIGSTIEKRGRTKTDAGASEWAAANGLRHREGDYDPGEPFELLRGLNPVIRHAFFRDGDPLHLVAFVHEHEEWGKKMPGEPRSTMRMDVLGVTVELSKPTAAVILTRHDWKHELGDGPKRADVKIGDAEVDKAWRITAEDAATASSVLTPAVKAVLMQYCMGYDVEFLGHHVLVAKNEGRKLEDLPAMMIAAEQLGTAAR